MTPELESIDHVHVFVTDRAAAADWYVRVLGFKPVPMSWSLYFEDLDGNPFEITSCDYQGVAAALEAGA